MKTRCWLVRGVILVAALSAAVPAWAAGAPKKVLVVTVTAGFRHSSIPVAEKVLAQLARESGQFTVDFVRQPEGMPRPPSAPRAPAKGTDAAAHQAALKKFEEDRKAFDTTWTPRVKAALEKLSPANLRNYDAVVFASTSGDLPLPDKQGFVDWIAAGHGFIGVHAASDTLHKTGNSEGFPPYVAMIGGAFRTHGPQVTVECVNRDSTHAACQHLPARWTVFDEIYEFKEHDPRKVHALLSLDRHPQNKEPGDFSVAWSKTHGKGRVFYTSLGHREDVWDPEFTDQAGRKNPPEVAKRFQQHVLGGILWALGLAPGSATP